VIHLRRSATRDAYDVLNDGAELGFQVRGETIDRICVGFSQEPDGKTLLQAVLDEFVKAYLTLVSVGLTPDQQRRWLEVIAKDAEGVRVPAARVPTLCNRCGWPMGSLGHFEECRGAKGP
jgi:hypothetical protein